MSFKLEDLAKLGSRVLSIDQVPSEFIGTISNIEQRQDRMGNNALFVTIDIEIDGETYQVVNKYTATLIPVLIDHLRELGVKVFKVGQRYKWKQKKAGRAFNPRWFPVEVVE